MARRAADLTGEEVAFLTERHLGTLTTLRADGTPHVVAIAFTVDLEAGVVRIITSDGGQKVRNIEGGGRAAVCQVDGPRWLTLEGPAVVTRDSERIADAVAAFEARYHPARENPGRVAIEITVRRVLGPVARRPRQV
ncbi:MAG: TIGR03618 family F420-dependent PPOX class oxidoreductase [Actinobacteria bacterium]|nr:TIGR03618 family F420-dependent PPOX class oxidoreductase [Actinomycetota bacterium]MBU1495005.1 TIGR03618 family F420-dependent PPOX class oxidoreductase [Actinomycetota bacterium]MBU1866036.1 TIGR03618 family F420-dependent PPOX class oxidoreductase [Actinomycetota bacterium]